MHAKQQVHFICSPFRRVARYFVLSEAFLAGHLCPQLLLYSFLNFFALFVRVQPSARKAAAAAVMGGFGKRESVVRLNGVDTEWFEEDLQELIKAQPSAIILPKVPAHQCSSHRMTVSFKQMFFSLFAEWLFPSLLSSFGHRMHHREIHGPGTVLLRSLCAHRKGSCVHLHLLQAHTLT